MEYCCENGEVLEPVSPTGQYFNSSVLSLSILAVLEFEVPIDDSSYKSLLKDVFLPINPRFSSIMVEDKKGVKEWKRVEVKLEEHIKVPSFPEGMSLEFYDEYFDNYLSKIASAQLPQSQPLWEFHVIKYPTSKAAGNIVFKLHHALGDGFSLMGALLSCLQRADNPSIPLTFPSIQSNSKSDGQNNNIFKSVSRNVSVVRNTVLDFGWSFLKSSILKDEPSPIRSGDDGGQFREFQPFTISTLTFSLDQIKQIKDKLKVTVNDVIMGIIFFGTRLYMEAASHEFSNACSTALVLLNTRTTTGCYKCVSEMVKPNTETPWGNYFTFLHVSIPKLTDSNSSYPLSFVMEAHQLIKRKRNSGVVYLIGRMLQTLQKFRGPEAISRYIYSTLNNSSMGMSNMIGPVEQMALANQPIRGLYFAVVGGPESLSITMMSYVDKMRVAIRMEKGLIDPQRFNSCIESAFGMIFKAAVQSTS